MLVRGLLALGVLIGLLAAAAPASANCTCSLPGGLTSCPTTCATCSSASTCCQCQTTCAGSPPACNAGYTSLGPDVCTIIPPTFRQTCERCELRYQCTTCPSGRYGGTCQFECPGTAANPCNVLGGGGNCSQGIGGSGACTCNGGFTGSSCQFSDALTCNGHGMAQFDGSCACAAAYTGAHCDQCAASHYAYPTCTFCDAATTCTGHGSCSASGSCACDTGFAGASCGVCAPDYFGFPTCSTICGDVNDDGSVSLADVLPYRHSLSDPSGAALTPGGQSKCAVVPIVPGESSCDVLDLVVLRRSLEVPALPPGRAPVCTLVAP